MNMYDKVFEMKNDAVKELKAMTNKEITAYVNAIADFASGNRNIIIVFSRNRIESSCNFAPTALLQFQGDGSGVSKNWVRDMFTCAIEEYEDENGETK